MIDRDQTADTSTTGHPHIPRDGALLTSLTEPCDVAALGVEQLLQLADELRCHLIDTVSVAGPHLDACLDTVELTIALHRVFHAPGDVLIVDTSYHTQAHTLLGRHTAQGRILATPDPHSTDPPQPELDHSWLESSHVCMGLACAHGLAAAAQRPGAAKRRVVVVLGDGALTGTAAWEGLTNMGAARLPVVVVVNDSYRTGAPALSAACTARGLHYCGPVDGHDLMATAAILGEAADLSCPVIVHTATSPARQKYSLTATADNTDRKHDNTGLTGCEPTTSTTGRPNSFSTEQRRLTHRVHRCAHHVTE